MKQTNLSICLADGTITGRHLNLNFWITTNSQEIQGTVQSHGMQLAITGWQKILQDKSFSLTNKHQENKKNKREVLTIIRPERHTAKYET